MQNFAKRIKNKLRQFSISTTQTVPAQQVGGVLGMCLQLIGPLYGAGIPDWTTLECVYVHNWLSVAQEYSI